MRYASFWRIVHENQGLFVSPKAPAVSATSLRVSSISIVCASGALLIVIPLGDALDEAVQLRRDVLAFLLKPSQRRLYFRRLRKTEPISPAGKGLPAQLPRKPYRLFHTSSSRRRPQAVSTRFSHRVPPPPRLAADGILKPRFACGYLWHKVGKFRAVDVNPPLQGGGRFSGMDVGTSIPSRRAPVSGRPWRCPVSTKSRIL